MSQYFKKTNLLSHPLSPNPPMSRLNSEWATMVQNSKFWKEEKLLTLIKQANKESQIPAIGFGVNNSISLKDIQDLEESKDAKNTKIIENESIEKPEILNSYVTPQKILSKIKLDDFVGKALLIKMVCRILKRE